MLTALLLRSASLREPRTAARARLSQPELSPVTSDRETTHEISETDTMSEPAEQEQAGKVNHKYIIRLIDGWTS